MRVLLVLLAAGCASKPSHVDLPAQLPTPQASATPALDELACTPQAMTAIEIGELDGALVQSRDYAQRCCAGDETGDVTVRVTPSPSGYQTAITIEPDRIASSPAGACVHAVFHRLLIKPYDPPEKTSSVTVRLR